MKSNELRIGNKIILNESESGYHGGEFETTVNDAVFNLLFTGQAYGRGIPLTEEWLLKFRFEANEYHDEFGIKVGKELFILDCEYTDKGVWNFVIDDYCLPLDIKHVHQLQNLYFALVGEELKIKQTETAS